MSRETVIAAGVAVALLAVAWVYSRGIKNTARDLGSTVGGAVVGAVDGVIGGTVEGIGDVLGVPRTDCKKCNEAISEFNSAGMWEKAVLSFKVASYCPAADYIKWAATGARPICK